MLDLVVTGGAGYIGSHVCEHLARGNYRIHVLDNLSQGHKEFVANHRFYFIDLLDQEKVIDLLQSIKPFAVIHLAGKTQVAESVLHPKLYEKVNVQGTKNLLKAMERSSCNNLLFSSTCAVFGKVNSLIHERVAKDPLNPYGRSKMKAEQAIKEYALQHPNFSYLIFRYFNVAGAHPKKKIGELHEPETHLIPLVIQSALEDTEIKIFGQQHPTPDGTCIRDYLHVCDIASAHLSALIKLEQKVWKESIHLGSGKGYSVLEIIEAVEQITGQKVTKAIYPAREGDSPRLVASCEKARRLLQFEPQFNLYEMIETAVHFKKTQKDK